VPGSSSTSASRSANGIITTSEFGSADLWEAMLRGDHYIAAHAPLLLRRHDSRSCSRFAPSRYLSEGHKRIAPLAQRFARRQLDLPPVLPQLRMLPANWRGDRDGMRVDRRPVLLLLLSCPIRRGSVVGMWESRVSEISKSLWKPFSGFHRDVISITVFAVMQG
jgi:hypothetical protein